jgi:hypothetical protein
VFAIGLFALFGRHLRPSRGFKSALIVTGVLTVMGAGFGLQQIYLRDLYQSSPLYAPLNDWAQHIQGSRIAITGSVTNIMYPLDGETDSNFVQVIGKRGVDGSFDDVTSCGEFDRLVSAGHYRYVVSTTTGGPKVVGSQARWLNKDPAARLVLHRVVANLLGISVFRIDGVLNVHTCAGS